MNVQIWVLPHLLNFFSSIIRCRKFLEHLSPGKWCFNSLQLWFDVSQCQTEALTERSVSLQLLLVLEAGKAANFASGRTFPGTPNSSVSLPQQTSVASNKQNWAGWMGDGMMVIATPRVSHGDSPALTTSPHTTVSAGVAADDLKLGLLQFFALCH